MTGQPPESSTLDALRAVRGGRTDLRRRMLPFLLVILAGVDYSSAKSSPGLGLHGASLALSLGLAGFSVGLLGIRQTLLVHRTSARVYGPVLALMVASSAVLVWVQPTGPGAGGFIVAVAIAMALGVIPVRLGFALILVAIGLTALAITEAGQHVHHQSEPGFVGSVFSFTGLFLYAMVFWRFRQQDEQSRRLLVQAEETHDAELRAATLAERQRLAREMHDVLAHSLSGLVVQLEGARLLAQADPAADSRLAATIDRAHQLAKTGLEEARQAISMLRDDELPGPGKLAALARSFEADTGVPCRYTATGDPRDLRSAVKLALYRVTQEALTNVRKHAHPEWVEVRLEYRPDEVTLAVEDFATAADPPPSAPPVEVSGGGYGLTGMRERAELLGGTLTAGPAGHGFLVRMRIPA